MRSVEQFKSTIVELKRRKVFRVASLYLIAAWGASLGVAELFPAFGIPDWAVRAFVIAVFLGFPLAVALAWAFEITAEGVVRDHGAQPGPDDSEYDLVEDTTLSATTLSESTRVRVSWHADNRAKLADFQRTFVIGRGADADVRLLHNKISRHHARVAYEKGQWCIEDLRSRNGTYMNGELLTEVSVLEATSEITLFKGGPPIVISVYHAGLETVLDG
jgi:hypothetical protein